jgi:hypothetical protein
MPTIDLTDAEHVALVALIQRAIEEDRFPRAPRLDPLRSALAKLDPAAAAALRRPLTPETPVPGRPEAHNPQRPPTGRLRPSTPGASAPLAREGGKGDRGRARQAVAHHAP